MNTTKKKRHFSWISLILYIALGLLFVYVMRGRFGQFFADKKVKNVDITGLRMTDLSGDTWSLSDLDGKAALLVF